MKLFRIGSWLTLVILGFLMSSGNALFANLQTMDDVPPTNPTRTNRFPSAVSRPQTAPTPQGTIYPAPTSSPAHQ